jgi:copper resistance protein B
LLSGLSVPAHAGAEDDPVLNKVMIDQLEVRDAATYNPLIMEAQGWIGKDLHKLWWKTDIDRAAGKTDGAELQMLYSQAIAPFWDFQVGLRKDFLPKPDRNWVAIGFKGLAPYFFDIDTTFFVGKSGRTALRLKAEYELMLTQKWVLSPDVTVNLYGKNDPQTEKGAGLSDIQGGLRLRYEIRRELAPYVGVNFSNLFGKSAEYSRINGNKTHDIRGVIGVRMWY